MTRSLYAKLVLVLLGLFFLLGISFVLISFFSTESYQQEANQKLNRELAKLIVAEKLILKDNQINQKALKEIFHMMMVINPSIEIYLLDPEGKILAFSAEPGKVKRNEVNVETVKRWLDGPGNLPLFGDDPRDLDGEKIFTAAPIAPEGRLEGYLYVILGGESYDSVLHKLQGSYILRLSLWVISISLLVAFIAGMIIFAVLTGKLKRLANTMDRYESGKPLDINDLPLVHDKGSDEIDMLVIKFKDLTERINIQMERLERSDSMRRELVANVSHDLRTPLATLRGYMETLLMKNESLSQEERQDYIKIAIRHCERLGILINDLFELAKLESNDMVLHPEPFGISEIVQDVVQKFELTAREKGIKIITNLGESLPFVRADIALIERVLVNLLENALRYTPAGGTISFVLSKNNDNIVVNVSDTGHGIDEKQLPRIFDRFYTIDKSRRGKTGNSGLGLAISKKIMDLHGTSIDVKSIVGSGTTFSFRLPVYTA